MNNNNINTERNLIIGVLISPNDEKKRWKKTVWIDRVTGKLFDIPPKCSFDWLFAIPHVQIFTN